MTAALQQASGTAPADASAASRGSTAALWGTAVLRAVSPLVASAVVAVIAWTVFLKAFSISPLVGKSPKAVWSYLVTDPEAAANRTAVFDPLGRTLADASLGFVGGMATALVVALLFVRFVSVEQALMPVAMLLRSVPLVAMTPLIVLVFGRGTAGITVIAGIVVFFPALVTIVFGLRSVSAQTRDLVVAYGGSEATVLRKVALPTALPAIFAAARISVPGAIIGALVAEWLATGQGSGGAILRDIGAFGYPHLWASIVALTAVSVLLYTAVGLIESAVVARFGPAAGHR